MTSRYSTSHHLTITTLYNTELHKYYILLFKPKQHNYHTKQSITLQSPNSTIPYFTNTIIYCSKQYPTPLYTIHYNSHLNNTITLQDETKPHPTITLQYETRLHQTEQSLKTTLKASHTKDNT